LNSSEFITAVRRNPVNAALLDRWDTFDLPDCWLVAGCLFQTIWNLKSGFAPTAFIKDYDVFYYDDTDLSFEAEDRAIKRIAPRFADLNIEIEIRNQARVHLWYEERFGSGYPRLASSCDGIDRFLVEATCVGVRIKDKAIQVYAPFGFDPLDQGVLRPNSTNLRLDLFRAKAVSYQQRWPWLRIDAG